MVDTAMPKIPVVLTFDGHESQDAVDLPERVVALMHTLGRFKQQVQAATRSDVEWAYDAVLYHVVKSSPVSATAVAEATQADLSTVSRQVAALVRDGLIERRADPADGRVSLLHPTRTGWDRYLRHRDRRDAHYREMLADWSSVERSEFSRALARFTTAFAAYKSTILADLVSNSAARPVGRGAGA